MESQLLRGVYTGRAKKGLFKKSAKKKLKKGEKKGGFWDFLLDIFVRWGYIDIKTHLAACSKNLQYKAF